LHFAILQLWSMTNGTACLS